LAELKKQKDLDRLARQAGLQVEETGWFPRQASEIPKIGTLRETKLGGIRVAAHYPVPDQVYTQKDAVYIFVFKESRQPEAQLFEKERARLQEQALAEKKQRVSELFLESLKAKAKIQVTPAFLEAG
jgi:hypothetical protein